MSTTLYFAYGSNLLKSRIQINNPSAKFKDIAKLENHRIDFIDHASLWNGSPATIIPFSTNQVWGAIWEISADEIKKLDIQEGVHVGKYRALNVNVINPDGRVYTCRVYQNTKTPDNITKLSNLPENRMPSLTYLKTIVKGALDCGLPDEYVDFLKRIKHNGHMDKQHPVGLEVYDVSLH